MRMRRERLGFTLVEVITSLGVILVIAAIVLAVYPRVKVGAKVTACKSNLRQIQVALELYKADNEGYEKVHAYVDLPAEAMRRPYKLEPYLKSKDVLFCPLTPSCAKKRLVSSYTFTVLPTVDSSLYTSANSQMNEWFKAEDSNYPVIHCIVHDEMEFHPSERHLADEFNPPFVVWLTKDGALKSGRLKMPRGFDVARICSQDR